MPKTDLVLEFHPVEVARGEWCDRCLLPAAVHVRWVAVSESLRVVARGVSTACECDGTEDES